MGTVFCCMITTLYTYLPWQHRHKVRAFVWQAEYGCFNISRDKLTCMLLKQVVKASLAKTRQQVWTRVSFVLRDENKKMSHVTLNVISLEKNSTCSMAINGKYRKKKAISAEYRSSFETFHLWFWCHSSKESQIGWKTPSKRTVDILKS